MLFKSEDEARNKARFTSSLSFEELLEGVSKILSQNGKFSTIIPFKEEEKFIELASKYNLHLNRVCRVKGTPDTEIKRSLLELSFVETRIQEEELIIEMKRHQYTDAYINLTKDFYLKM